MRRLFSSLVIALLVGVTTLGLLTLRAADEQADPAPAGAESAQASVTTSPTPTTRLYVKTVPPGAHLTLDGKPLGPSDGLFIVPPGVASLKVEFAGQEPRVQQVEIAAGRITRLEIDFAEQPTLTSITLPKPVPIRPTPGTARVDAPTSPPVLLPHPVVLPPHASRDAASRVVHILPLADAGLAEVPVTAEMTPAVDIVGALVRPLPTDLVFDGVPLREVVQRLGEAAEIGITIDESRLRAAGIDPESPITARPGGVPLGSALSAIARTWQLRWLAEIDHVVITTSGADQGPTHQVYIVADLIDPNDPAGIGLFRFLSEASWPVEQSSVTPYRPLTIGRTELAEPPPEAKHATLFLVRAEWWRQFRVTRLVALLRQLRKTPVADRVPLSADGYWSDSRSAAAARAALDRPLESDIAIDGVPLGDAIAMLSEAAGVPIAIDSVAFAGSPRMQRPVAFSWPTKGQTLAAVLERILDNGLGYEVARDQLTVTSASVSAAAYYPVDDLLAAGHTFDALRSRIGTQGGPVWVIEGGVNCLAITRNTAGHRRVEKILRSLGDEERRRESADVLDATAVVGGLTAKDMFARFLERMAADVPVAGEFRITRHNQWPAGLAQMPDVKPDRPDPILECRWAWDSTNMVGEWSPNSAGLGFLRTEALQLEEVVAGQWHLTRISDRQRLGRSHPGWFYGLPGDEAWSDFVVVDPAPQFEETTTAGTRWMRLATKGFVGKVRLCIREADFRLQGYELFVEGNLFRRLVIEQFAVSDDGRAFPAKARMQTWDPGRPDEPRTVELEAIEVRFPKGKAETARSFELILPRGSTVYDRHFESNNRLDNEQVIREPTPASEVMARSQLRSKTAERPAVPTGGTQQHEAMASLRVLQRDKDDYEAYRKTHAQLIKSPFVFAKALRQPGIAELPTLAGEKDPVGWLARNVETTAPRDAEIIEVRLRGERADDVTQIVDTITTAYLTEVVQKERLNRIERRKGLEQARNGAAKKLLTAREALSKVTAEGDREQLQGEITMWEESMKLLDAELDHSAKGIAEIPDRVVLLEKASVSSSRNQ